MANSAISTKQLRSRIRGRAFEPGDPDYDEMRKVFVGGVDKHPAVIVRVADAADVARCVDVAREDGFELAVRSGGHSASGYGVTEGGIVIDLRDLRNLAVNVDDGSAWADAGLTARDYSEATHAYGLATGFGDTGSVGIGGLTVGGGIGLLSRKYGLTVDDLIAAEVVTADGQIRRADAQTNPELYWAIRGGGGNFGVSTRFEFRLHQVGTVLGGLLILPATAETITSFVAAAEAAPDELTTIANVMPAPPLPFIPAEHRGKIVILATVVYDGAIDVGQHVLATIRSAVRPIADLIRPMQYPEIFPPDIPDFHPMGATRNMYLDTVDHRAAEVIMQYLETSTAVQRAAQIRVLGGAIARVPNEATAYAHRTRRILVNVAAAYSHIHEAATHQAWADAFWQALRSGQTGAYVNFLGSDGTARIHEAYPGQTWERLTRIKARYDPTNLFHLNQNVTVDSGQHPAA